MQTTKTVSAYKLRNNLGEYLNLVNYQGIEIIIQKMNKPVAKISPIKEKEKKSIKRFKPPVFNLGGIDKIFSRKEIYG